VAHETLLDANIRVLDNRHCTPQRLCTVHGTVYVVYYHTVLSQYTQYCLREINGEGQPNFHKY